MRVKNLNVVKKVRNLVLILSLLVSTLNVYPLSVSANSNEILPLTDNNIEQGISNIEDLSLRNQSVNKIGATLKTPVFENVITNQSYTVEYEVNIPEISTNIEGELYDEVVFLVDISNQMYGDKWSQVKDFFASYFEGTLYSENTEIGIVPFRNEVVSPDTSHGNNTNFNQLLNMREISNINMIKDAFGKDYLLPNENNDQRNIVVALEKAQILLEEGFHLNKKQAVIIVSSGAYHNYDPNKVDNFAKYKHKIITVDIMEGNDKSSNSLTKAEDFHYTIGGTKSDYIKTVIDGDQNAIDGLIMAMDRVNPIKKEGYVSEQSSTYAHSVISEFDEVIVAIDASSKMYRERWDQVKSFFENDFRKSPVLADIKFGIIPYTTEIENPKAQSGELIDINRLFDGSKADDIKLIEDIFGNNYIYAIENKGGREIYKVVRRALDLFEKGREENKKQALIIVSTGGFENYDWNDNTISQLKDTGITTITINTDTQQELQTESTYMIHQKLGGLERNYLNGAIDTIPSINGLLSQIFEINTGGDGEDEDKFNSDIKLKFELGPHLSTDELKKEDNQYILPITGESNSTQKVSFDVKLTENIQSTTFESAVLSYVDGSGTLREKKIDKPIFNTTQIPNIKATLKSANPYTATLNSEIELVYGIDAEPFEYTKDHNELKEIVFVIDGTAKNDPFYSKLIASFNTRVFGEFIEKNNVRVGLVVYGAKDADMIQLDLDTDIKTVKETISSIRKQNAKDPDVTTELKKAADMLEEGKSNNKNIIILTGDNFTYSSEDLKLIKDKYNIFSMEPTNWSTSLAGLHKYLGGKDENYIPYTGNGNEDYTLGILLTRLNAQLVTKFTITDAFLNLNLDKKFIDIENKDESIKIQIPSITYNLIDENGKKIYKPEPIKDISFRIKAKEIGEFTFAENKPNVFHNYLSYSDLNKQLIKKFIVTPTILVEELAIDDYKITMKVSDVGASVNKEYNYETNGAYYTVTNEGETYKLYGPSNVEIKFEGTDLTHLRYQFVKEGTSINEDQWKYISGSNDINLSNPGYLTQMPYDVSHMELLSNNQRWSNRQEVFKTAFSNQTGPISMAVSPAHNHNWSCNSTNDHYVIEQQVVNAENKTVTRYVPKTLFVQNHSVSSYAPNYKEASKTWGYFKAPQTGDYYFRTYADDGFFGTLAVNNEPFVIGDDFKPRGSSAIDSKTSVYLKAGEFYPIYLEYFNWGGSADYRIMYSIGNKNNFKIIDSNSFYPSNSDTPTDGSNNIFMGNDKVSFVTDPGVYTIYYEAGNMNENQFESKVRGAYGKFEVESRFELTKTLSTDEVDLNEEFLLTYTVRPKNLKLTDLYKVSSDQLPTTNIPSELNVLNLELKDELPKGMIESMNKTTSGIYQLLKDVTYTRRGNEYVASEQTFTVRVKANSLDAKFESQTGALDYRDVSLVNDLRISQKQQFKEIPSLKIYENSVITKHGLFNGESLKDGGFKVVDQMAYQVGFMLDAKGLNNSFTVQIPEGVKIDKQNVYIYELNEFGSIINKMTPTVQIDDRFIRFESNRNKLILYPAKQYIVTYQVIGINANSTIKAELFTGSKKDLELQFETEMPDLL